MSKFVRGLLSLVAAALVPATIMIAFDAVATLLTADASDHYAWLRIRNFAILAVIISAGHVGVLGLPAFFLLHHLRAVKWWSTVATGFLLGCVPIGILGWPLRYAGTKSSSSHWDGERMVNTMVNGVPTMAGWMGWLQSMGLMGLFGAAGGFAFWLVWRQGMRPNNSFKPNPLRGSA